jgi:hypothetical protein
VTVLDKLHSYKLSSVDTQIDKTHLGPLLSSAIQSQELWPSVSNSSLTTKMNIILDTLSTIFTCFKHISGDGSVSVIRHKEGNIPTSWATAPSEQDKLSRNHSLLNL